MTEPSNTADERTARTLHQKIVDDHTVEDLGNDDVLLFVDLHVMNEYTSPQAFAGLVERGLTVAMPAQQLAVVDHIIPTHPVELRLISDPQSALQASSLQENCASAGITCFHANHHLQGIEHVVAPELGLIRPGMVALVGDSHATTYGAFGALGFGIGTSEVEHVLATQTLVYRRARDMRIQVDGALPTGCSAKDLILHVIGTIGAHGARGFVVEFVGTAITRLSIEARMTLCNMSVEAGARSVLIGPDASVLDYIQARAPELAGEYPQAVSAWTQLRTDDRAEFDSDLRFDAGEVAPQVTWGTSPDQTIAVNGVIPGPANATDSASAARTARALEYMGLMGGARLEGLPVDRVFIGSCTNGRIEDLRAVAAVAAGRHVAPGVRAMVVPGSQMVRRQAEAEGVAEVLIRAGFEWRQPGCSMCLAMNDDVLGPLERCASTTNRNFEGRQGRAGRTHLMSPAMAAAAAVTGRITDLRSLETSDV